MEGVADPEIVVPPSTWTEDFKKVLDRADYTDLQLNVKVCRLSFQAFCSLYPRT